MVWRFTESDTGIVNYESVGGHGLDDYQIVKGYNLSHFLLLKIDDDGNLINKNLI